MKYMAFLEARLAFVEASSGDIQERLGEGLVESLVVKPWVMSYEEAGCMINEINQSKALTVLQKGKIVAFISDVAEEDASPAGPAPAAQAPTPPADEAHRQVAPAFHHYLTAKECDLLTDVTVADTNKCILLANKARMLGLDHPSEMTFAHWSAIIFACTPHAKGNFKIGAGDRGIDMVRELKSMHAALPSYAYTDKVKPAGRKHTHAHIQKRY